MELNMNKTEKTIDQKQKEVDKAFDKLRKDGLIADVIGQYGIVTMLTAKGFEKHRLLSLFSQINQVDDTKKPKKSGQEKMDSAIKTIVQVGAGISQLMEGLGKLAGDPVKMDMSQAGIDIGQNKSKQKQTYKKRKKQRTKR
jgi:hypothetical protein